MILEILKIFKGFLKISRDLKPLKNDLRDFSSRDFKKFQVILRAMD